MPSKVQQKITNSVTEMKKFMIFAGITMAVTLVSVVLYRLMNILPPDGISNEAQAMAVFNDAACLSCHQRNAELPFYAGLPIVGNRLKNRAAKGYFVFDASDCFDKINRG